MCTHLSWTPLGTLLDTSCLLTRPPWEAICSLCIAGVYLSGHPAVHSTEVAWREVTLPTACPQAPRHLYPSPHSAESPNCTLVPSPPTPWPHTPGNSLVMLTSSCHLLCPAPFILHSFCTETCSGALCTHHSLPVCAAKGLPLVPRPFIPFPTVLGRSWCLAEWRSSPGGEIGAPALLLTSYVTLGGPFSSLSVSFPICKRRQ